MTEPSDRRPLFERYPDLAAGLPLVRLAQLPTPVRRLEKLANSTAATPLWIKDDGPSSSFYGGNKVRKLELVLAAARARNARTVMTFGYAGSNHATATAVHASRLGMRSISMLLPQQNAAYLRKNLLISAAVGAELHEYSSQATLTAGALLTLLKHRVRDGSTPFLVAPGGSSPLGTIGFVNAAFELAEQVAAGLLPMPERLYVAAGSLGTAVGLGIGLAALELPVHVVAVRVVDEKFVNPARAQALWRKTVKLLRANDPAFPDVGVPGKRISFRGEFFGAGYARSTTEAAESLRLADKIEGLDLDITYTAKALACALADGRSGLYTDAPVLFWNTRNSADLSELAADVQAADLPRRLRRYFEPDGMVDER